MEWSTCWWLPDLFPSWISPIETTYKTDHIRSWLINVSPRMCCRQLKIRFNTNWLSYQNPFLPLHQYFSPSQLYPVYSFPLARNLENPLLCPNYNWFSNDGYVFKIPQVHPFHPNHHRFSERGNFVTKSPTFNFHPSPIHSPHCLRGDISKIHISYYHSVSLCISFIFNFSAKALW